MIQQLLLFVSSFLLSLFIFSNLTMTMAAEMTAAQVITEAWKRYRMAKKEMEEIKIVIRYEDGRELEKQVVRWTSFAPDKRDRITIKFMRPILDKNLGLLTWCDPNGNNAQWLRMPSWRKCRLVGINDESKYFGGTDLTYEDTRQLTGERVQEYAYHILDNNETGWIIEALPLQGTQTCYGKRIFSISSAFVITDIDYFGKNKKKVKTQKNIEITVYKNGMWRPEKISIENHLLNRKTIFVINNRVIDDAISGNVFNKMFLLRD